MNRLEWLLAAILGLTVAVSVGAALMGRQDAPMQSCGTDCTEADR